MPFLVSRVGKWIDRRRASLSRADVLFYAAASIDEVWIRSTLLECQQRGLSCVFAVGGRLASDARIALEGGGVRIFQDATGSMLHALKAPVVVTASSGVPRSMFRDDVNVVAHMPHSIVSLHMIYPEDAFDGFDVLLAAGPHHVREFERLSALRGLEQRPAFPAGYGKFDLMKRPDSGSVSVAGRQHVLIAPSWGVNGLLPAVGVELVSALLERDIRVTLRPHPLHVLANDTALLDIREKFGESAGFSEEAPDVPLQSMLEADVLITDFSGTAFEFAWLRRRPTLFVDVGKKVVNESWGAVGLMPVEVGMRESIGRIVPPRADAICDAALDLGKETGWGGRIDRAIPEFLFDAQRCCEPAANAIETLLRGPKPAMGHVQ